MARNPGGKRSREETTATASDLSFDETAEGKNWQADFENPVSPLAFVRNIEDILDPTATNMYQHGDGDTTMEATAKDYLQEEDLSLKDDLFVVQLFVADSVFRRVKKLVDVSDPHNNKRMEAVEPMLEERRSSDGSGEVLGNGGFGLVKRGRVDGQEKSEKLTHNEIVKGGFLKMWTQEISGNVIMMGSDHSVEFHGWFMELSLVKGVRKFSCVMVFNIMKMEGGTPGYRGPLDTGSHGWIEEKESAARDMCGWAITQQLFMFEAPCYEHAISNDKQRMAMLGDLFTELCDPVISPADRLTATQVIAHLEFIAAEYDDADVSQQDIAVFHEEEEQEATSAPGAPVLVVSRLGELQAQDVDRDQGADVDEMAAQAAQADLASAVQEAMTAPGAPVLVVSRLGELQAQDFDRDQGADLDEMAAQAALAAQAAKEAQAALAAAVEEPVLVVSRLGELQAPDVDWDQVAPVDDKAAQAAFATAAEECSTSAGGAPVCVVTRRIGKLQAGDSDRDHVAAAGEKGAQAALATAAEECSTSAGGAPVCVVTRRLGKFQARDVDWGQAAIAAVVEGVTTAPGAPVCVVTRRLGKFQARDVDWGQVAAAVDTTGAQAASAAAVEGDTTAPAQVLVISGPGKLQAAGDVGRDPMGVRMKRRLKKLLRKPRLLRELQCLWPSWLTTRGLLS
eukprot:gene11182-18795_t